MQYLFIYTMCIYLITQNIFQAHILTYSNYYVQISLKQYSLKMYFVAPQIHQERVHRFLSLPCFGYYLQLRVDANNLLYTT
jgi:hypothetical protein